MNFPETVLNYMQQDDFQKKLNGCTLITAEFRYSGDKEPFPDVRCLLKILRQKGFAQNENEDLSGIYTVSLRCFT